MKRSTEDRIQMNKHYIVVDALDLEELMMEVNEVLATGEWAVAGGPSHSQDKNRFIQALTRIPA